MIREAESAPMTERFAGYLERLKAAVIQTPGDTTKGLRQEVEARAEASISSATPPATSTAIPPLVAAYVDTVSRHAYKVTDEQVNALREAGHSQDAIFEITVAAAVGAAAGRLERGLALLRRSRS